MDDLEIAPLRSRFKHALIRYVTLGDKLRDLVNVDGEANEQTSGAISEYQYQLNEAKKEYEAAERDYVSNQIRHITSAVVADGHGAQ